MAAITHVNPDPNSLARKLYVGTLLYVLAFLVVVGFLVSTSDVAPNAESSTPALVRIVPLE